MDRGAAAGGDRAARPASAAWHRRHDREAYLARVRELLPANIPATFLPQQAIGISTEHLDYPGTLTLPTEVALKTWTALGTTWRYAGIKKLVMVTSHGGNSAA